MSVKTNIMMKTNSNNIINIDKIKKSVKSDDNFSNLIKLGFDNNIQFFKKNNENNFIVKSINSIINDCIQKQRQILIDLSLYIKLLTSNDDIKNVLTLYDQSCIYHKTKLVNIQHIVDILLSYSDELLIKLCCETDQIITISNENISSEKISDKTSEKSSDRRDQIEKKIIQTKYIAVYSNKK